MTDDELIRMVTKVSIANAREQAERNGGMVEVGDQIRAELAAATPEIRRRAIEEAAGLLYERAEHFASQWRLGSPYRHLGEEERAAAAGQAREWYEAERQVRRLLAATPEPSAGASVPGGEPPGAKETT